MKRLMMFTVLLGLVLTARVEASGHNAKFLAESLATLLNNPNAGNLTKAGSLWTDEGDLLASSSFERYVGPDAIKNALGARYEGATITVEAHQAWPGEASEGAPPDLESAPGIQFVSWVYRVKKAGVTHYELFTAIARKKHLHPPYGPVDTVHADQYRFLTVRLLPRPEPQPQEPTPKQ
jgi:hypothetical protein